MYLHDGSRTAFPGRHLHVVSPNPRGTVNSFQPQALMAFAHEDLEGRGCRKHKIPLLAFKLIIQMICLGYPTFCGNSVVGSSTLMTEQLTIHVLLRSYSNRADKFSTFVPAAGLSTAYPADLSAAIISADVRPTWCGMAKSRYYCCWLATDLIFL